MFFSEDDQAAIMYIYVESFRFHRDYVLEM